MTVAGRALFAGDGHAKVLAIPRRCRHGIVMIQAEVLQFHGDILEQSGSEDKDGLIWAFGPYSHSYSSDPRLTAPII